VLIQASPGLLAQDHHSSTPFQIFLYPVASCGFTSLYSGATAPESNRLPGFLPQEY
jgi:hypothetical protein